MLGPGSEQNDLLTWFANQSSSIEPDNGADHELPSAKKKSPSKSEPSSPLTQANSNKKRKRESRVEGVEPTEPTTAEINHDSAEANSKERETGNASAPVVLSDEQKKHLFDGMQISVIGKFSMPQNDFKKLIAEYGAVPLQNVSLATTHLIATQVEYDKWQYRVNRAATLGRPIVSEQFILDSIAKGQVQDINNYLFKKSSSTVCEDLNDLEDPVHEEQDLDGPSRKKRNVSIESSLEEDAVNMLKGLSNSPQQKDKKKTSKYHHAGIVINNPVDCVFEFSKK